MGNGLVHDVSPPKITSSIVRTWALIGAVTMWLLSPAAYAGDTKPHDLTDKYSYEKPAGKKSKPKFEGKVEIYSFKEYLDWVDASDNPGVKVEWKWKLGSDFYAWGWITQSFSDEWEGKTNFWNTRYIKWGWKWEVEDIWVHAWWAVADTAVWDFWDANFTKGTLELSRWDFTATWYLSAIEAQKKWKKWATSTESEWKDGWGVWISYHLNDNLDIGFMTWEEAKSWMSFSEIITGIKYEIAKNLYIESHLEYQLEWSEEWQFEPRIGLTYKIKPKSKDKKYKS